MAGDRTSSLFDSGAVGGPNAGQGSNALPFANPWSFILALEGAIYFVGALSRRAPPESASTPSFPFQVQASATKAISQSRTVEFEYKKLGARNTRNVQLNRGISPASVANGIS
jgi:CRISPR-associated protein Csx17